jgi:hypothetical protein
MPIGRAKSCCGVGPAQAEAEKVDSAAVLERDGFKQLFLSDLTA